MIPDFKRAYKKAARLAARTPGFPSKDKILVGHKNGRKFRADRKPTRCDVPGCGIRNLSGLVGLRAHKKRSHQPELAPVMTEAESPINGFAPLIASLKAEMQRHLAIVRRLNTALNALQS